METRPNRRDLLKAAIGLAAGAASLAFGRTEKAGGEQSRAKENLFLLRYDTERGDPESMKVGSRAGAVVRKVVALSVSRVSPFVPA